jgi:hypothetical protein
VKANFGNKIFLKPANPTAFVMCGRHIMTISSTRASGTVAMKPDTLEKLTMRRTKLSL